MTTRLAKDFRSFADLAAAYARDKDYRIVLLSRPASGTAIIAPHGGRIEAHTSDFAREIAGTEFSLYLFEGLLKAGNFMALHLASHLFDEQACIELVAASDRVVTVHGCSRDGERVLLGGRDRVLRSASRRDCGQRTWRATTRRRVLTPRTRPTSAIADAAARACSWRFRWRCGNPHDAAS